MKRLLGWLLLLSLLLSGCTILQNTPAPTDLSANFTDESPAPQTAVPTSAEISSETAEPTAETTEPEPETTEADAGLTGTVMELSQDLIATVDAPQTELTVSFPETDLAGAPEGRLCKLLIYRDGSLFRAYGSFLLVPGAEATLTVPFAFTRYMAESSELTAVLHYGDQSLTQSVSVALQNYPDEVYAAQSGDKKPYSIDVLRNHNVVVVNGKDAAGEYTVPVKVFVCSTGRATPSGYYSLGDKHDWGWLFGGVCGQYVTRITGNILFHSVPYYSMRKDSLETEEYNKLGTAASMGCVRLPVRDSKWIYDNCPYGTSVHIYDVEELPVEKPEPIHIDPDDPRAGWDPTDPDEANPWMADN